MFIICYAIPIDSQRQNVPSLITAVHVGESRLKQVTYKIYGIAYSIPNISDN